MQVFVMAPNGSRQLAAEFDHVPSYAELDTMVTNARKAKLEIFEVRPVKPRSPLFFDTSVHGLSAGLLIFRC
jgi:hypothetical protein